MLTHLFADDAPQRADGTWLGRGRYADSDLRGRRGYSWQQYAARHMHCASAIQVTPELREANFTLTVAYKAFVVEVAQLSATPRSAAALPDDPARGRR